MSDNDKPLPKATKGKVYHVQFKFDVVDPVALADATKAKALSLGMSEGDWEKCRVRDDRLEPTASDYRVDGDLHMLMSKEPPPGCELLEIIVGPEQLKA
jgi:hypothetical protein